jgi:hypothetical protein
MAACQVQTWRGLADRRVRDSMAANGGSSAETFEMVQNRLATSIKARKPRTADGSEASRTRVDWVLAVQPRRS